MLRQWVAVAMAEQVLTGARSGLSDFNAVDSSGQPELEDEEVLAGDYPAVRLWLRDGHSVEAGHLFITST